jgi:hypothetical protein
LTLCSFGFRHSKATFFVLKEEEEEQEKAIDEEEQVGWF